MGAAKKKWDDRHVDAIIATLLTVGVALAAVVVMAGGAMYLSRYGLAAPDYRVFRGEPSDLRDLRAIVTDAMALRSRELIQAGLLILIATPVMRVAFSVFVFLRQRDRLYIAITLFVLAILIYSLFGGMK